MTSRKLETIVFVVLAAVVAVAAWALWNSTEVPGSLHLAHVDTASTYPAAAVRHARAFEHGSGLIWLGATAVQIIVFALFAWRGAAFMRDSAAGPVGTGLLLGMLAYCLLWAASVPFGVLQVWWERRYHVENVSYWDGIFGDWAILVGTCLWLCAGLAIIMGFARWIGKWWWLAAAPCFLAGVTIVIFVQPYLITTHPLTDPAVKQIAAQLEDKEGVHVPIRVENVSGDTSLPNAFATGLGPSRRVVLFDTLVGGQGFDALLEPKRFSNGEIKVVIGHELGHLKRNHLLKDVGWEALFFFSGLFLVSLVARRRGGMGEPAAVPLALLVVVFFSVLALPIHNAISRHTEAEADWVALQTTKDPNDAEGLFRKFVPLAVSDPNPPWWEYVLFENHPTSNQRVGMARAWKALYATSDNQSP